MRRLCVALAIGLTACAARAGEVLSGLDVLIEHKFQDLQGKKIGLITNQTGRTRHGESIVDAFVRVPGLKLQALFSPEHGFQGIVEDSSVSSDTLRLKDGRIIPVYSLYGDSKAPTPQMLSGLDALVFDIQDVGTRFYTYATTMGMAMEAAAAAHIDFYVLDRPDPIRGDITEGAILNPELRHFNAYFDIPIRHGLTMGEIARFHNLKAAVGANLHVIPLKGWNRDMWYDQTGLTWTQPSPNMPNLDAAILYPGIGCLEAANVSVGRGTPLSFRWVGAPWLNTKALLARLKKADLPGLKFDRETYSPKKPPYKGKKCYGIRIRVTDRDKVRSLDLFAHIICAIRDLHPMDFDLHWTDTRWWVGREEFKNLYDSGAPPEKIVQFFREDSRRFEAIRNIFLLY